MQEESWGERSEILRLGLSEMMDERNDLRQIILSLEKWRRDGRISAADYAELKAKYGKRLADADRLIEELEEQKGLVERDQVEHSGWLDFEGDECFEEFWRCGGSS